MFRVCLLSLILGEALVFPSDAAAAAPPGVLDVTVSVSDEDQHPVADAIVEAVDGTQTRWVGRTGSDGSLQIHVGRGERLQARAGSAISPVVTVESATLSLVVRLRDIGSVAVRAAGPQERTTAASVRALVAGSVTGALGYIPDYRSASAGGSGRQSLNGIPLDLPAPPGAASASGGIPSELIASFDAVQADDGLYPDYHLLSPTPAFAATAQVGAASFDGTEWKATVAGPHGNLHYALALASGTDQGTLAGQTFSDQSGVNYNHSSGARYTDASLTGNTKLGAVNLSFLGFLSSRSAEYISTSLPGSIVEGLGPGNRTSGGNALEFLLATWSRGRDSFSIIDGRYAGNGVLNFTQALVDGAATPSYSGYAYNGSFDQANWTRSFGESSFSLKASINGNLSNGFSGVSESEALDNANAVRMGSQGLGVSYRMAHGDGSAGASLTARYAGGAFPGSFLEAAAFAAKRIAGTNARIAVSTTAAQAEEASYATSYTLAPPQTANIVCAPANATVSGPSDTGVTHPRASTIALSLSRGNDDGEIRAGAFRSNISNALVLADVNGIALPQAYIAQLTNFFDSLCPGSVLAPASVFVQRFESIGVLQQAEFYVGGVRRLGPFAFEAFYETFSDSPAQTPAGLAGAATTLVAGQQLAGVPLHRAGITVAFSRRTTILAIGARFVSANNTSNLPSHVVFDAGFRARLGPGALEASAQNVFGAYSGSLSSPRYALPLATTAAPLPTLATPIQRTWTLRYAAGVGPRS